MVSGGDVVLIALGSALCGAALAGLGLWKVTTSEEFLEGFDRGLDPYRELKPEWLIEVERLAEGHNGVAGVRLDFGHDGDRTCTIIPMGDEQAPQKWERYSCEDMERSVRMAKQLWELCRRRS